MRNTASGSASITRNAKAFMEYDCAMESIAPDWVSETRFGKWFLSTEMWYREVLALAVAELRELGGTRLPASFERLMDAGCGQGRTFSLLRQHFAAREIVAVDIDPLMLE